MAEAIISSKLVGVILTGFLPPLLWLFFWLREDPHPEPRKKLITSFILGMAVVPVALALEYIWYKFSNLTGLVSADAMTSLILILPFAFIEEISKFAAAWWADLKRSAYYDEPVDAMIYLITVALGFSALENMLYISKIFTPDHYITIITASFRFFGATFLHTVASGAVGASIALSFFHKERQNRNIIGGILLASALHSAFNAFIINSESPLVLVRTLFMVWTLIIMLIFVFEKIKRIRA